MVELFFSRTSRPLHHQVEVLPLCTPLVQGDDGGSLNPLTPILLMSKKTTDRSFLSLVSLILCIFLFSLGVALWALSTLVHSSWMNVVSCIILGLQSPSLFLWLYCTRKDNSRTL
nr:MAG TPA: hypothetical protein [Caudoviricetes sp.]